MRLLGCAEAGIRGSREYVARYILVRLCSFEDLLSRLNQFLNGESGEGNHELEI